jgi:hypothetical protein
VGSQSHSRHIPVVGRSIGPIWLADYGPVGVLQRWSPSAVERHSGPFGPVPKGRAGDP